MMPGVGFEEMILLVVVAIIVIGPKDLPLMMRKFGRFTGKMRAMAFEFKQGIDELGRQAELEELRKEVANLKAHTGLDDLRKDLDDEKRALQEDVNAVMAPVATHPAIAAPAAAATTPEPAPYAGLSPDHPGYDTGEGNQIGGPASANGEHVNGYANGEHVNGHADGTHPIDEKAGEPHIIPEDHVAAQPIKQDTPA
ncbi:MAG: Sec-independent protein translocase protein TatB [Hyphomonadaceae bacterium]